MPLRSGSNSQTSIPRQTNGLDAENPGVVALSTPDGPKQHGLVLLKVVEIGQQRIGRKPVRGQGHAGNEPNLRLKRITGVGSLF